MAENNGSDSFLGHSSFQEYYQNFLKSIVTCTKASNEMSRSHDDHEFWTSFEEYKEFCSDTGVKALNMIGDVLRHQGLQCKWQPVSFNRYPHTDIEDRFESVVEGNDMLLERVDSQLDEILCPSKTNKPLASATSPMKVSVVSSWNKLTGRKREKSEQWRKYNLLTARNIQRPQLRWKRKVDNSNAPFVPILTIKPNAIKEWKPAERFKDKSTTRDVSSVLEDFIHQQRLGEDYNMFEDRHPYIFELDTFEPQPWQLEEKKEQVPKLLEDTPLTIVADAEKLVELLEKLKQAKEIAVDLEHHSYRSFLGFTCLMQISTRNEDFLVDTLSLREDLFVLNEVFTDPNILKVFHGADKDIEWLQRDFGLYIVNMFDTGQAARVLQLERHSLAFLLKLYCDLDANKQYQLADWRLRPIPDEMVKYAREDTHYLLFIYDNMRNTLISKSNAGLNILKAVYSMSKVICSKVYEKPIFTPDTYLDIVKKYKCHLNPNQLQCMKLLVAWRDHTAREEDESYGYVLPNHMMIRIAEKMPRELEGVLACCNPVPPLVKQNVAEISTLVKEARLFDARKVSQEMKNASTNVQPSNKAIDVETLEGDGFYTSSLTGFELVPVFGPPIKTLKPRVTIFGDDHSIKTDGQKKATLIFDSFRSPFELYLPKKDSDRVDPAEINKKWIDASTKEASNDKVTEKVAEAKKSLPKEELVEITSHHDVQTTLRDELPKKKRKQGDRDPDAVANIDSPVLFSYEKAATGTEFVPFDYSKAKMKKQDHSSSPSTNIGAVNFGEIVEEPLRKGVVNDRRKFVKSGERSVTFKRT
eukprot:gene15351-16927_t